MKISTFTIYLTCNSYFRHDGGDNIIQYYDCLPYMKPCPTTTLRNSMNSTNIGEEINVESLPQQSSRIYTMSYTSTVSKYLSSHVTYWVCVCSKPGLSLSFFFVQRVQLRGDCSFCRYWWYLWQSLFRLFFHNSWTIKEILKYNNLRHLWINF